MLIRVSIVKCEESPHSMNHMYIYLVVSEPILTNEEKFTICLQTFFWSWNASQIFYWQICLRKWCKKDYELRYEILINLYENLNQGQNSYLCDFSVLMSSFKTTIWILKKSDLKLIHMINHIVIWVIKVDFNCHLLWLKWHFQGQMLLLNKENKKMFVGYKIQVQETSSLFFTHIVQMILWLIHYLFLFELMARIVMWNLWI